MAVSKQKLPETIVSPETGETLRRGVRPSLVTYKGKSITVQLPGYYPESGDEGVHVGDDMAVTDAALRALKEEVEGIPSPAAIPASSPWRQPCSRPSRLDSPAGGNSRSQSSPA